MLPPVKVCRLEPLHVHHPEAPTFQNPPCASISSQRGGQLAKDDGNGRADDGLTCRSCVSGLRANDGTRQAAGVCFQADAWGVCKGYGLSFIEH